MQIESLKVIADVARFRSFSRAASANSISQSAVSQIVLQLEKRLGVQLVDRSTRPLRMTDPGKQFAAGCEEIVLHYQELEDTVRGEPAEQAGSVHLAAIYSIGLRDMHEYVEQFTRQVPGADVHIDYLHPDKVYERIQDGAADIGIVSFPRKNRDLVVLPWREERMVLACPPGHVLARQESVRPAQLEGIDFVAFDRGLVIRREIDRYLRDQGLDVTIAAEFDNIENIKKAVIEDAGVSLLPRPALRPEVEAGTLVAVPLRGCRLTRPVGIVHRRNGLNPAAARFLQILQEPEPRGESQSRKTAMAVQAG